MPATDLITHSGILAIVSRSIDDVGTSPDWRQICFDSSPRAALYGRYDRTQDMKGNKRRVQGDFRQLAATRSRHSRVSSSFYREAQEEAATSNSIQLIHCVTGLLLQYGPFQLARQDVHLSQSEPFASSTAIYLTKSLRLLPTSRTKTSLQVFHSEVGRDMCLSPHNRFLPRTSASLGRRI